VPCKFAIAESAFENESAFCVIRFASASEIIMVLNIAPFGVEDIHFLKRAGTAPCDTGQFAVAGPCHSSSRPPRKYSSLPHKPSHEFQKFTVLPW
jgi:hypothetical protein